MDRMMHTSIWASCFKALAVVLVMLCSLAHVASQPLSLEIRRINAANLPLIKLRVCLSSGGLPVQWPGRASYRLTENGVNMPITVDCPDSGVINSVEMVLDNSGSMGLSLPDLKTACHHLVDSLRVNDEAELVAFGPVRILQTFTPDKNLLHAAINSMTALGSTALWDASLQGLQRLSPRGGKRVCIILTDGIDNASAAGYQDVIAAATAAGIKVFTIGFSANAVSDDELAELAERTGGEYFRVFSSNGLVKIFEAIASDIVDLCCTITYTADRCTDSIRAIRLDAALDGRNARADTAYRSPFRADAQRLIVEAPPEIAPLGNANVYFSLQPGVHAGLACSFRFLVRYDPGFLDVAPMLPITLGTAMQNTSATVHQLRPGVLQFFADAALPGLDTEHLIGVRFKGLAVDSSRPLAIAIDSLEFQAGCPLTLATANDTMEYCLCRRPLPAWLKGLSVKTRGEDFVCEVFVADTAIGDPMLFTAELRYDAALLTPTAVETFGTVSAPVNLRWETPTPGILRILADEAFAPRPAPALFRVVFRLIPPRAASLTRITLPSIRAWARCCPAVLPDTSGVVAVDGACERILVRTGTLSLRQNHPNPARAATTIRFTVGPVQSDHPASIRLMLYDLNGNLIRRILDGVFPPGEHTVNLRTSDLQPGAYHYVLESDDESLARTMTVMR
jgi:VWFA-related protein